eukprot:SAG25_NODE_6566_length_550_cov_0.667406_2_plen_57_part_01
MHHGYGQGDAERNQRSGSRAHRRHAAPASGPGCLRPSCLGGYYRGRAPHVSIAAHRA